MLCKLDITFNGEIDANIIIFVTLSKAKTNNHDQLCIYIIICLKLSAPLSIKNHVVTFIIELDSLPQCKTLYINATGAYIITLAQINKHIVKNNSEVSLTRINAGLTIKHIHAKT
jgi:hypothetical protein